MPLNISLFGPQGSGKGTQAEKINENFKLPLITPGNIFREHLKEQTELGREVKKYLDAGDLVPDEITNQIIGNRLQESDCQAGFVLDGYPRNLNQVEALRQFKNLTHVIIIEISDAEAKKRIVERRVCACGMTYHLLYNPPKVAGRCDRCGKALFQREDDTAEALGRRLEIYHRQTEPLIKIYEQEGILHRVNGEQSIVAVWQDIKKILND